MNYTGIECPVCNEKFNNNDDDVVVCPVCGTPHHRSCWQTNGCCKNEDKHAEGFIWQMPELTAPETPEISPKAENSKICPRCGEKNAMYEPVCTRCGERLKANTQTIHDQIPFGNNQPFGNQNAYGETFNPNNFSPYQNVYAADARTVYGESARIDDVPVTEVAEYVQKDSNKYIGKFLNMQEKKTKLSWNWSAFLCSVYWCFYRKLTGCGLALVAILFSCSLLSSVVPSFVYEKFQPETYEAYVQAVTEFSVEAEKFANSREASDEYIQSFMKVALSPVLKTSLIMQMATTLLISVIFGFLGNYFYRKKVIKDITKIRQVAVDSMSYHMYIQHRGGVSIANVLLPMMLYMLMNMFTGFF